MKSIIILTLILTSTVSRAEFFGFKFQSIHCRGQEYKGEQGKIDGPPIVNVFIGEGYSKSTDLYYDGLTNFSYSPEGPGLANLFTHVDDDKDEFVFSFNAYGNNKDCELRLPKKILEADPKTPEVYKGNLVLHTEPYPAPGGPVNCQVKWLASKRQF